jgi:hypothetical protein
MDSARKYGYTLTTGDVHGVATIAPPHVFKIRGGCEGGGKGYLGQDEQAFTITTGSDQQVAVADCVHEEQSDQFPSAKKDTHAYAVMSMTCSQHAVLPPNTLCAD